jgi:hypothetical protein
MQIHRPLQHHIEKLTTAARRDRAARIWLQRNIIEARRQTRDLVFMAMVARMAFQKREARWTRPPSARSGFRYEVRTLRVQKIYTRGLKLRTLKDIRTVLDDFERIVKRAIARLPKHISTGRLVAVAPPALTFLRAGTAHAPEGADTS